VLLSISATSWHSFIVPMVNVGS